jgi:cell division control protein 45
LGAVLGLESSGEGDDGGDGNGIDAASFGGVEVWVVDAHRPWNLGNVFGGFPLEPETEEATTFAARAPVGVRAGCIDRSYRPGKGGIVVFDDGDIEDDLGKEKDAYLALVDMPDIEDNGEDLGDSEDDEESDMEEEEEAPVVQTSRAGQKRKSWDFLDEDSEEEDDRPKQRRRSNSVRWYWIFHPRQFLLTLSSLRQFQTRLDARLSAALYHSETTPSFPATPWNHRPRPNR